MPRGGEWKELFHAAQVGNLSLIQYHLDNQVNPNWQHPEYFTAPIFEAIRNGQLEAVRLLLQQGKADPCLIEEMTDCQPLEVALEEKQHDMVDLLLEWIPKDDNQQDIVKSIIFTGAIDVNIIQSLLRAGHEVILLQQDRNEKYEAVITKCMTETGNKKLRWIDTHSDSKKPLRKIHVWIHRSIGDGSHQPCHDLDDRKKVLGETLEELVASKDVLTIQIVNTIHQQKGNDKNNTMVIIEPSSSSWWYQMTYSWWSPKYLDFLVQKAISSTGVEEHGKAFNHQGVVVVC